MMKTRSQVLIREQLPVTTSEVAADLCDRWNAPLSVCLYVAVKRKKAILSDSEDEDEEKADKPGEVITSAVNHG